MPLGVEAHVVAVDREGLLKLAAGPLVVLISILSYTLVSDQFEGKELQMEVGLGTDILQFVGVVDTRLEEGGKLLESLLFLVKLRGLDPDCRLHELLELTHSWFASGRKIRWFLILLFLGRG